MRIGSPRFALVLTFAVLGLLSARAEVRLPAIFSDHMVLQQGRECAIWGWADPGEKIEITIGEKKVATTADAQGKWNANLPKLDSEGPYTITIRAKNTVTIKDVLVGEVWLGSGQSNMAFTVNRSNDYEGEKAKANLPRLRMFTVAQNAIPTPQPDCKGQWVVCTPDTVGTFSAALYFHGRELHSKLGVPMGLIHSSWGGTPIESWVSAEKQTGEAFAYVRKQWKELLEKPWDEKKAQEAYKKSLAAWKKRSEKAKAGNQEPPRAPQKPEPPALSKNRPANLFNGMIAPLIPYTIRGAVWYQGEANSGVSKADCYGEALRTLITDWRNRWGCEFPFAWVQLPDFRAPQVEPSEPNGWVTVREQMLKTLKVPNTGMAVTIGLGEANNIHPKNKQEVGRRLAAWALAEVYGKKDIVSSGPIPAGHEIRGNEIVITFTHTESGLSAIGGQLKGFAIAGSDKKFVWAKARIEGDKVILSSPEVAQPAAARYAWAQNPVFSLQNGAGLPATPFRTDAW